MHVWLDEQGGRCHELRRFGTVTADLLALMDWLKQRKVTHVAMEATACTGDPCGRS
jgi:hypothetical protein